jgi:hypothetical protein
MGDWRHTPYLFPSDNDVDVLFDVFDRVSGEFGTALESAPTDKFVVAFADLNAAVRLRLILDGDRWIANGGLPIFQEHEVIFAVTNADECETVREECPAGARWFAVILIYAQTDAAWRAFDQAYWSVAPRSSWQ